MKSTFALVFCISVILLMFLSGAIKKDKPELLTLAPISLYDRMTCMQDCAGHKVVATLEEGEELKVLNRIKGKTKIILRVEAKDAAGWVAYDETKFLDVIPDAVNETSQN